MVVTSNKQSYGQYLSCQLAVTIVKGSRQQYPLFLTLYIL